jgi:hypothetical protein
VDERCIKVFAVEPTAVLIPYVRSLVVVEKISTAHTGAEQTVSFYLSSRVPCQGCAQGFAAAIRGHWGGCEIRNHWIRDALWGEDKTRSKNWHINANLAILRATLIGLRAALADPTPWPEYFERCQRYPSIAYQLVSNHRLK